MINKILKIQESISNQNKFCVEQAKNKENKSNKKIYILIKKVNYSWTFHNPINYSGAFVSREQIHILFLTTSTKQ